MTTMASLLTESTVPLRPMAPGLTALAWLTQFQKQARAFSLGLVHFLSPLETALLVICMLYSSFKKNFFFHSFF